MVLFREIVNMRRTVLVIYTTLSTISVNVGQLVDGESVLFVERGSVEGFCGGDRLLRGLEFDERIPISVSLILAYAIKLFITLLSFLRHSRACK